MHIPEMKGVSWFLKVLWTFFFERKSIYFSVTTWTKVADFWPKASLYPSLQTYRKISSTFQLSIYAPSINWEQ